MPAEKLEIYPPFSAYSKLLMRSTRNIDVDDYSLKKLLSKDYEDSEVESFLGKQVERTGILSKRPLERLAHFKRIYRPFRRITFQMSSAKSKEGQHCESLIDEEAAPFVTDSSHRLLLWRPKYVRLNFVESKIELQDPVAERGFEPAIDELILTRWKGQELDDEIRPKLRSLQADPLSAIALIIPRQPASLRREEEMLDDTRESHAYVVASSMITNSSTKDIIQSYTVGERFLVETIYAEYESLEESKGRILFLETPGASSLGDAKKAGAAITRLSNLYGGFLSALKKGYRI